MVTARRSFFGSLAALVGLSSFGRSAPGETKHGYKLGDIVIFKSGGPKMKIIGFSPNGRIWCEWYYRDGRLDEASYLPCCVLPEAVAPPWRHAYY